MKIVAKELKKQKTPSALPSRKKTKSRRGIPRFVFEMEEKQRSDLHALSRWLHDNLKVKVSSATLVRIAVSDLLGTYTNNIHKARDGAFHAKLRKHSL